MDPTQPTLTAPARSVLAALIEAGELAAAIDEVLAGWFWAHRPVAATVSAEHAPEPVVPPVLDRVVRHGAAEGAKPLRRAVR